MTDVRIVNVNDADGLWADFVLLPDGQLDETQELANLVKVALLTDARADEAEVLPDPDSTDRRGWWGDYEAELIWGGWPIGCKNWLLTRAKITSAASEEGSTLVRAEQYARAALRPLVTKKICSRVDVRAERVDKFRIDVLVTIYRGPKRELDLRFADMWSEVRGS